MCLVTEITAQEGTRQAGRAAAREGPAAGEPVILDLTKPKNPTIVLDTVEMNGRSCSPPDKKRVADQRQHQPLKRAWMSAQREAFRKAVESSALGRRARASSGERMESAGPITERGWPARLVIQDVNENRVNGSSFISSVQSQRTGATVLLFETDN